MGEQTAVRGVDQDLWRRFRAEAVRRGLPTGTLLNDVIREWLAGQGRDNA